MKLRGFRLLNRKELAIKIVKYYNLYIHSLQIELISQNISGMSAMKSEDQCVSAYDLAYKKKYESINSRK